MAIEQHTVILFFLCCISTSTIAASQKHENLTRRISKIEDGKCVKGQIYKIDCNTCHCIAKSILLCTKMACIRTSGLKKGTHIRRSGKACTPGTFYKDACRRCFCSNQERLFCGPEDCRTVDKLPTTHHKIHAHSSHSPAEPHLLPTLPHQSAQCNPGSTYRVNCNTCLCLANGNLVCGQLLCPSYDEVNKREAKKMSRKPCVDIGIVDQGVECVQCWCVDGANVCQALLGCAPMGIHVPNELRSYFQCTPGAVYKLDCNRCLCNENRSLQCTLKNCLDETKSNHLHRIQNQWIDYTLRRAGDAPVN